jgi:hypothetical protein
VMRTDEEHSVEAKMVSLSFGRSLVFGKDLIGI